MLWLLAKTMALKPALCNAWILRGADLRCMLPTSIFPKIGVPVSQSGPSRLPTTMSPCCSTEATCAKTDGGSGRSTYTPPTAMIASSPSIPGVIVPFSLSRATRDFKRAYHWSERGRHARDARAFIGGTYHSIRRGFGAYDMFSLPSARRRVLRSERLLGRGILPCNPAKSQGLSHIPGAGIIPVPQGAELPGAVEALDGVSPNVQYLCPGVSLRAPLGIKQARPHFHRIVRRSSQGNQRIRLTAEFRIISADTLQIELRDRLLQTIGPDIDLNRKVGDA